MTFYWQAARWIIYMGRPLWWQAARWIIYPTGRPGSEEPKGRTGSEEKRPLVGVNRVEVNRDLIDKFVNIGGAFFCYPFTTKGLIPHKHVILVIDKFVNIGGAFFCYPCTITDTIAKVVGHLDYSFASAWHPDGCLFATGNQDKTSRVWDIRNLSLPVAVLRNSLGAARSIRFSSDGQFLVVAEPADFVHIYSTKAYYKVRQEIDFFGEISGVSMSPDDESLYIGIWDRTYASLLQYNRRH
ncbi:uncharacterized WD repeat-containing protein C2A9.03-like [Malus domestica]|uniref:uncharacterized WD repeat-containing protein C2A9.03-like n=1 Tax=Malus domestica TaxID=3750 RepID=UPI0007ED098F